MGIRDKPSMKFTFFCFYVGSLTGKEKFLIVLLSFCRKLNREKVSFNNKLLNELMKDIMAN